MPFFIYLPKRMKTTKTDFFEELYPIDLHQSFTKNKQPNKNNIDKCEVK